jgi:hypothetical protein
VGTQRAGQASEVEPSGQVSEGEPSEQVSEVEPAPRPSRPLGGVALIAALVALAAFAAFTAYMIAQADGGNEVTWTRLAWLFSSVEAIAFGAAGALFGASVHRERAENAEADARQKADAAARGRALAAAVKAEAPAATRGGGEPEETTSVAARHARLARELFPD